MKTQIQRVIDKGVEYDVLTFSCPGCVEMFGNDGIHMLPVNTTEHKPSWTWDGNLEAPTLDPSIATTKTYPPKGLCHSLLKKGVFEFQGDSTHSLKGQNVPMLELPEWVLDN